MSLSPVYEEWLEKTLDEGRLQERRSLALKMLRQEFDIQTIAQLTELSLEQVQQLQKASQTEL
jgi:predicted transposase YdaD